VKKQMVAFALLCCGFQAAAQQPSANAYRASPGNGQVVYMRAGCYACHGTVGHGGAGARLAPNPLPLAAFQTWVRNGTPGWNIASGMPAFSATVVTDEELADVRAFLASQPAPRAANDIPLLNP
jgi:ubiquinol-cytochrome c reductase cytochrome c subunit